MVSKSTVAIVAVVAILAAVTIVWAATHVVLIPTSGVMVPPPLSIIPPQIDWDTVNVGVPVQRSVDITNNGDVAYSGLIMTTTNVVGLTDFTVTWDADGTTINPGETLTVTFELTVTTYTQGDFSFDITITGDY